MAGTARLDEKSFYFVEIVTRADLERHPAWRHYDENVDRERILAWGVDADHLEAEVAKFDFCGPHPLFPVLELGGLADASDLSLRVDYRTAGGLRLPGFVILPNAYGIFVGDRELCFNRSLPSAAERQARALASALGVEADALFPLHFESTDGELRVAAGEPIAGTLEAFWS